MDAFCIANLASTWLDAHGGCLVISCVLVPLLYHRGVLQQLSDSARAYGHMMSSFCLKLQWPELALVLKQCVNERFESDQPHSFGADREVNAGAVAVPSRPLTELTRLRPAVANVLYQHGLTNLSKINEASLEDGPCAGTVGATLQE